MRRIILFALIIITATSCKKETTIQGDLPEQNSMNKTQSYYVPPCVYEVLGKSYVLIATRFISEYKDTLGNSIYFYKQNVPDYAGTYLNAQCVSVGNVGGLTFHKLLWAREVPFWLNYTEIPNRNCLDSLISYDTPSGKVYLLHSGCSSDSSSFYDYDANFICNLSGGTPGNQCSAAFTNSLTNKKIIWHKP